MTDLDFAYKRLESDAKGKTIDSEKFNHLIIFDDLNKIESMLEELEALYRLVKLGMKPKMIKCTINLPESQKFNEKKLSQSTHILAKN